MKYQALIYLGLPEKTEEDLDYEELMEFIKPKVAELLNRDLKGLLNVLYRLDVSEEKFKKIISEARPEELTHGVCKLIIEREKERLFYRKKYSGWEQ